MTTDGRGHVFLVHGQIESIVHDAAVVPTDDYFSVRSHWWPLLGMRNVDRLEPANWPANGVARAAGGVPVWFVSVGSTSGLPARAVVERGVRAVREIADAGIEQARNRAKPLVAMPIIGIAGGGHDARRGEVIESFLEKLTEAVQECDVDVALVAPQAAVYAAAQHVRRRLPPSLNSTQETQARRLGELARRGELALFMAAGVSIPAGLPSWPQLIEQLSVEGRGFEGIQHLSALDQAQLLEQRMPDLGERVARIVRRSRRPSLAHALLAGLGCREAITTNYDRLYEKAIDATGRPAATILPWQDGTGSARWVLKMHGDVKKPGSIVLTRRHFVRFDATTRPAGALLQTLLLTRHLLFVGASLNDDNVVRLAHEVQAFRDDHGLRGSMGTLVDVNDDRVRRSLWKGQLNWVSMPGAELADRTRALEIFLDRVAHHASDDASWLLDERFESLLEPEQRDLAHRARELHRSLEGIGEEWARLVSALEDHGADGMH